MAWFEFFDLIATQSVLSVLVSGCVSRRLARIHLFKAIEALVSIDSDWMPSKRGQAFYIRPLIFGTEAHLEVRPSRTYRLIIMTSPVRAYFDAGMSGVALQVEETFTRSAPGGMGAVKTAGNYAASLFPTEQGVKQGLAQALWLDAVEHKYVEEVGAMNIFFRIDGTIVTPDLRGTILPGITRESVITLHYFKKRDTR